MQLNNTRLFDTLLCTPYWYYNGLISVTMNYVTAGTWNHHDGDAIQSNPWDCTERIRFGSSRLPTDDGHGWAQQRHGSWLLPNCRAKLVWILVMLYSKSRLLYMQRRPPDRSVCRAVAEYGTLNVATTDGPAKVCSSPSGIVRIPFLKRFASRFHDTLRSTRPVKISATYY
ncbi:uncharacterized protein EURHEDRAFT_363072 [Aspergillus ruber CBS 135680]|uniref:Uncharacterized protein n=1 Tax=Aspergillus ruber (strain CBS 135680) TaxID=1388766 RepID=A0A017SIM5_ASPRC|nr:uncharacterized protein EURHEDRAFT_363072 [Aspergillus ruber CBS 135680]EYE96145.1 hypothetical protein EURHEDRAFT_363072 [Aspergillus ruber CBS 135680]